MTDQPRRAWGKPYNNFSWAERRATIPVQNAALRDGRLIRPTVCCICGDDRDAFPQGRDYRFLHLEDYRRPLDIYPVCKGDHAALHARFDDPGRWEKVIRAHSRPGEWFTLLSLDPASQETPYDITYPRGLPPPSLPVLSPSSSPDTCSWDGLAKIRRTN
jgi:hypothetical protein